MKLNPTLKPPKNESQEHFLLKQVAAAWLKIERGCQVVGTEIARLSGLANGSSVGKVRTLADAAGVRISSRYVRGRGTVRSYAVHCVEVKVSRKDLRNGYCSGGDFNYVMAPVGVLTAEDIPAGIGWLEVDVSKLRWHSGQQDHLYGIMRRRDAVKAEESGRAYGSREAWATSIIQYIAHRLSNDAIYRGLWFYPGWGEKDGESA